MKILLILVGAVVLIILSVVVIGFLLPKGHVVSRSASYRASPERLFQLVDGPQNWRPDVARYETVPNSGGQQLIQETTRDGNTVTYEVMDRTPPISLTRRIATKNLPYSGAWTYRIQPQGDHTVVRITENGEVYNPIFRFMSRFILGQTRTLDAYLRALGKNVGQDGVEITD